MTLRARPSAIAPVIATGIASGLWHVCPAVDGERAAR